MPHAIRIHDFGGPEVLRWEEVAVPRPAAGEALVRTTALGLNYIDVYYRTGRYPLPLPATPGMEGAGVVEAIGRGVTGVKPGDRVAWCMPVGSQAEYCLRPAHRLVKIPRDIDDRAAAAMMLKGLTAHYLLRRTWRVRKGDTILLHAAAGGVGQIAAQWAKHLGATVIGTVGSEAKVAAAKQAGCKHVIVLGRENLAERVRAITKGEGVPVVYDGNGRDTFAASLGCLAKFGLMVSFGNASGDVPPVDLGLLNRMGSLYLTRPSLFTYVAEREDLLAGCRDLFSVVRKGAVRIRVNQAYPLAEAAQAHRDLEARRTTGSTLLIP